jgi:dihydrofolate synthase/folylpolyglutamate synthase
MDNTVQSTLKYLFDLQFFGMKLGLENTLELLRFFDNPQRQFPIIHVAGTNGKGSTCALLAAVFQSAGLKTGLYTSPHIHRFSERIRINGVEIPETDIIGITARMRGKIDALQCTFFEATTAMAFQYFAENGIDIGIIETGLGGRLDATNTVQPELSVITNIDFDHTEHLGKTIPEIAFEKAGIIKPHVPCIVGASEEQSREVFTVAAKEKNAELLFLDDVAEIRNAELSIDGSYFDLRINLPHTSADFKRLHVTLAGEHQINNAALSVIALLLQKQYAISEDHIRNGLKSVDWKGRLELISRDPFVLVDAAHNPAGMKQLRRSLEAIYRPRFPRMFLIIGMLADKEYESAVEEILPVFDFVYTVTPNSPRALDGKILESCVRRKTKHVRFLDGIADAVNEVRSKMSKEDLLVIAGSHFVLSEI